MAIGQKRNYFLLCNLLCTAFALFILSACGDSHSASDSEDIVSVDGKTISGVSQKGPFIKGSSVTAYELAGRDLSQTGKSFEGDISNDFGEFNVAVKKLESQFVLLKANGYYRNEVSGEKSNSPITLYALSDLKKRDEVNVNLLTHLEYKRAIYLVREKKLTVKEAKKQAAKEILESFGIDEEYDDSENLNIFGSSDGNGILLAISILLQGNLNEADFSERIANLAQDIEEDGKWDDTGMQYDIADWAVDIDYQNIRRNIEAWNLDVTIPDFENTSKPFGQQS